ncbi:MAG: sigma-54 dependent transcriptional regulator [Burkholderiales bacterium]
MSAAPPAIPRVLVIDDEPDLRTLYELSLLREGYRVETAADVAQALEHLRAQRFDAVITDMRLPDGSGLEVLNYLKSQQRPERCVVMTAYGSAENAVEALKTGAFDYLTKPVDLKQFRGVVASAIRASATAPASAKPVASAYRASAGASDSGSKGQDALARMVGDSEAMLAVKQRIGRVARGMAPVLVRGESGTGKELVARALHANSHRSDGPLVAVNCGAIPENLLEAEFFGAKKGAYTGAAQDREGYFQAARNGTLFLDEIGDLPLAMQAKLLRAIQERSVRPIGSTTEDSVDVRIVSATHKDLAAEVKAGRFRQDLYYRLNVIELRIPPLRERRGDLPALCEALLARIAADSGMDVPELSAAVREQIMTARLPGNVRELENLLHRSLALSDGEALHVDGADSAAAALGAASGPALLGAASGPPALAVEASTPAAGSPAALVREVPADLQGWLDQHERDILVKALNDSGFNRTAAAARLGLSLRQIRYRIARLNIAAPQDDEPNDASS